jgi:uncharacterized membrane protein YheB (UPF0754 family)
MTDFLWTLPLVGALVGWATNWLAVRMLFRPREARRVLGFTFVGLIPRRRTEMAARIAATIEKELVRPEDIAALLDNPELAEAAREEIDRRVCEFLTKKFGEMPAIAKVMMPSDLEERLRKSVVKHVMAALPEISKRLADELGTRLDVKNLVEERINGFDMETLERMILEIASRELRRIELLGGVIGALVGGAQWALLYFLPQILG